MSNDIYVHRSFEVEVVGVGEMSESGWECVRGCGLWFLMWVRLPLLL